MSDAHYWVAHWWPAPAKLNLMLNICGRRDDGYHELQTVFQLLSFCDWINVVPRNDQKLSVSPQIEGVDPEHNLILRAAKLLQTHSGCEQGANIQFRKALPMGAGLGGGSSDAATTLVVLNRMWGLGYSDDQLAELGLDVPLESTAFWVRGLADPRLPATLIEVESGLVKVFRQQSWVIKYDRFDWVDGAWLPHKITLTSEGLLVRFVVDNWGNL